MMELTVKEVQDLVNSFEIPEGYRICHHTHPQEPFFPNNRKDICAIRRGLENDYYFGYDTVYLVWRNKKEGIHFIKILDSKKEANYGWELPILEVRESHVNGTIEVRIEEKRPFRSNSRTFSYHPSVLGNESKSFF